MSITCIPSRWVLLSAFTGVLALSLVPGVRAQSSPADSPAAVGSNQPVPMAPGARPLNSPGDADTGAPGTPAAVPAGYSSSLSALDVIRESIFGDIYSPEALARWTPLPLSTFFTEGWDQPYVVPTAGSGGAPRHAWIGAFGGNFFRAWYFAFAYDQGVNSHIGNGYLGRYEIFVPFNRRYEMEIRYDFIVAGKGGTSGTYHGNTGDMNFIQRLQLSESKNFGQLFQAGFLAPTGRQETGGGVASVAPQYQFWYNIYGNWVLRAATGVTVPTNHAAATPYTTYNNVLAIGRYFQGSDDGWIRQLWFYLVATENSTIAGSARRESYFSLLPGTRNQITGRWYFFTSVEVPMIGPHPFSFQPTLAILKDY